VYRMFVTDYHK